MSQHLRGNGDQDTEPENILLILIIAFFGNINTATRKPLRYFSDILRYSSKTSFGYFLRISGTPAKRIQICFGIPDNRPRCMSLAGRLGPSVVQARLYIITAATI